MFRKSNIWTLNRRTLNWLQIMLIGTGCLCLTVAGIRWLDAAAFQRTAAATLDHDLLAPPHPAPVPDNGIVGRLEIPRVGLSVMVVNGDDDDTLSRAVGHLRGTAFPWEIGNTAMAGHRDTFFRPLKEVREGDAIRITTVLGTFTYRVTGTEIVGPDDVSVLAPTPYRALTLVTCYPFVYVGRAPKRFIIHAR
jgi:sortase A